jgi:hypothetical protein
VVHDGRTHVELINAAFLAGGSPAEYLAGIERAITMGGYGGINPGFR